MRSRERRAGFVVVGKIFGRVRSSQDWLGNVVMRMQRDLLDGWDGRAALGRHWI